MEGDILTDYTEEPLAVKSFSTEEVYSTISKIGLNAIDKNKPQSLLVISETDEVNAETLAANLNFNGEIDFINKSINVNEQFIEVSGIDSDIDANMISYITLEAVGAAVSDYDDYPLNINFLPVERIQKNNIEVGNYEIDLLKFVGIMLLSALLLALLISFASRAILQSTINSLESENQLTKAQVNAFKTKVKNATENKDIFPTLKQIVDNNNSIIVIFNALSTDIPNSVYIRKFISNEQGGIGIIGEAKSSAEVDNFIKGLKEKNGDLTLSKLSVNTKYDPIPGKIPNGFTFEIKTSSHDVNLDYENPQNTENYNNNSNFEQRSSYPISNSQQNNQLPPPPVI